MPHHIRSTSCHLITTTSTNHVRSQSNDLDNLKVGQTALEAIQTTSFKPMVPTLLKDHEFEVEDDSIEIVNSIDSKSLSSLISKHPTHERSRSCLSYNDHPNIDDETNQLTPSFLNIPGSDSDVLERIAFTPTVFELEDTSGNPNLDELIESDQATFTQIQNIIDKVWISPEPSLSDKLALLKSRRNKTALRIIVRTPFIPVFIITSILLSRSTLVKESNSDQKSIQNSKLNSLKGGLESQHSLIEKLHEKEFKRLKDNSKNLQNLSKNCKIFQSIINNLNKQKSVLSKDPERTTEISKLEEDLKVPRSQWSKYMVLQKKEENKLKREAIINIINKNPKLDKSGKSFNDILKAISNREILIAAEEKKLNKKAKLKATLIGFTLKGFALYLKDYNYNRSEIRKLRAANK